MALYGVRMRRLRHNNNKVVINDNTRLFIEDIDKGNYQYHSCATLADIAQPKNAHTNYYCASPTKTDDYIIVAQVHNSENQPGSTAISTNFTKEKSFLKRYFDSKCKFNFQLHISGCDNPNDFNNFDKALLFYGVEATNYAITAPMAGVQQNRNVITENIDVSFDKMLEIYKPNFVLFDTSIVSDGPIIDSFTFCEDSRCALCTGGNGRYFVQLLSCGDDCQRLRIIYTLNNGMNWNVYNIPNCETIGCTQNINTNIVYDVNNLFSVHINALSYSSITDTIRKNISIIPKSEFSSYTIFDSFNVNATGFYVGESGRLFIEKSGIIERKINAVLSVNDTLYSVHSYDGDSYIIGASSGTFYIGNLENDFLLRLSLPVSTNIKKVYALSNGNFLLTTSTNGGYVYENSKLNKMVNLNGVVTALDFNDDVGYAASLLNGRIHFWQSVDGGKSWANLGMNLSNHYIVSTVSVCQNNPNIISMAGRKMNTPVSNNDALNPLLDWNCEGNGFVLLF